MMKAELLGVLDSCESNDRDVYDYFVDYMSEENCFVGRSGQSCMFESYGTIIEFTRVMAALQDFTRPQLDRIAASLRVTDFTPLAPVLAGFLERWNNPALAA